MPDQKSDVRQLPLAGLFLRVYWMVLGPVALLLSAITIARSGRPQIDGRDLYFAAFLAGLLAARAIEFAWLGGWDCDGKPASTAVLVRWLPVAAASGLALLGLAHGIARVTIG